MDFNTWNVLAIVAAIALIIFFKGKNAVWGTMTLGLLIGLIVAAIYYFKGDGFQWQFLKKAAIIGTLCGLASEILGRLGSKIKSTK